MSRGCEQRRIKLSQNFPASSVTPKLLDTGGMLHFTG